MYKWFKNCRIKTLKNKKRFKLTSKKKYSIIFIIIQFRRLAKEIINAIREECKASFWCWYIITKKQIKIIKIEN